MPAFLTHAGLDRYGHAGAAVADVDYFVFGAAKEQAYVRTGLLLGLPRPWTTLFDEPTTPLVRALMAAPIFREGGEL